MPLMLRKKNEEEAPAPGTVGSTNTRGITSGQDVLQHYSLMGLAGVILALLLTFAYLFLVRENGLQQDQIRRISESYATQQAASIDAQLEQYGARLKAAARSPLALAAIASRQPKDLALVEKALLDYFPELSSLKLVALGRLGVAGLESDAIGLRNHIELDLLRRAADGEPSPPESYRFQDRWLTSFAQLIDHPEQAGAHAVLLATLDNSIFAKVLSRPGGDLGRFSLQQVYARGNFSRAEEIASAGSSGGNGVAAEAILNSDTWKIVFTPSERMLSAYRFSSIPLLAVFALLAAVVLIAVLVVRSLSRKAVNEEVGQILKLTDSRSELTLSIPQLVPLARELRRLAERQARHPAGKPAVPRPATPEQPDAAEPSAARLQAEQAFDKEPAQGDELPSHIFRAYDIRGIVKEELDENAVTQIGRALGTLAGERGEQALIVGFDGRNSSPSIKATLVRALVDSGRDVIDIGRVPTPALYYATHTLSTRSGVMVTASHNPASYNGFKITLGGHPLAGEDLRYLTEIIRQGKFSEGAGRLAKSDIRESYIEAIINDVAISSPLKIVVDAGNGVAGELAPLVLESLACEVTRLYCDIDGDFPNHHPDPGVDANLADLREKVVEVGADFGVAYDGDGDRLTVVTADGTIVRNDILLMLFAQDIVSRNPGTDVVFDIKSTLQLTQVITGLGGRPILWKTGHAFMREKVMESGALLGGEFSGHFYFGERWYGFDDAIYATARLAEIISATETDLGTLLAQFPKMENTPEIHIPVSDTYKFELMQRVAEKGDFSPGKVTTLDGVRVDYNDGWGLLRASNTTPALIARFEGRDVDALRRIKEQFRNQLKTLDPALEIGF
jgi:phosphomannomutase/phosphoglucomutase